MMFWSMNGCYCLDCVCNVDCCCVLGLLCKVTWHVYFVGFMMNIWLADDDVWCDLFALV